MYSESAAKAMVSCVVALGLAASLVAWADPSMKWAPLSGHPVEGIRFDGQRATLNPDYWSGHVNGDALELKWKKSSKPPVHALKCSCSAGSGTCDIKMTPGKPGTDEGDTATCTGSCSGSQCLMGSITVKTVAGP